MNTFMEQYNELISGEICCNKKLIKGFAYIANRKKMSGHVCNIMCISIFIFNLMSVDMILKLNIIPAVLYWMFARWLPLTVIDIVGIFLSTMLLLSVFGDVHRLLKNLRCNCTEKEEARERAANEKRE